MQKIFLEKLIDLNHQLKEMVTIAIDDSINYQIETQGIRSIGSVEITGEYTNDAKKRVEFKETLQLDILAPYEKVVDRNEFNVKIQDFDYKIVKGNLLVVIEAVIHGVMPDQERRIVDTKTDEKQDIDLLDEQLSLLSQDDVILDDILVQHFDGLLASDFFASSIQKTEDKEDQILDEKKEETVSNKVDEKTASNIESAQQTVVDKNNVDTKAEKDQMIRPVIEIEKKIEPVNEVDEKEAENLLEIPMVDKKEKDMVKVSVQRHIEAEKKRTIDLQPLPDVSKEDRNESEWLTNPNLTDKTITLLEKIKKASKQADDMKIIDLEKRGEKMNELIEKEQGVDSESEHIEIEKRELNSEFEDQELDSEKQTTNMQAEDVDEADELATNVEEDVSVNMTYSEEIEISDDTDDYLEDLYEDTDSKYVSYRLYVVSANDSYETIADKYEIPVEKLKKFNNNKEIVHKAIVVIPFDE